MPEFGDRLRVAVRHPVNFCIQAGGGNMKHLLHSKGFRRWCVTLITTKLLDFVHRPVCRNPDDGQSPEA
jgi:hypothetical protein